MIPWCKFSLVASLMSNYKQANVSVFSPLWSYSVFLLSLATPFFENLQECNTLVEGSRVVRYGTGNVLYPSFSSYQSKRPPQTHAFEGASCLIMLRLQNALYRKPLANLTRSIELVSPVWAKLIWRWWRTFLLGHCLAVHQDNRPMLVFTALWTHCKL